ncbi:MAG: serine/threonine-protein kinase, partial [Planctomycetota bacterium]
MSDVGPGARVGGYEVLEVLGRGGYGDVLRVRAPDGSVAALKLLHRLDAAAVARFERERRLLETLGEAEGFVPVVDDGTSPEGPFLVMPFMEGGTLEARIARAPMSVAEARSLGIAVARALGHAHARGIVHRDVKPANVLYDNVGRVRLTDFGIAHLVEERSESSAQYGTPAYMAPEQFLGLWRDFGPWTDLYALGAMAWELTTGHKPYGPTESWLKAMAAHVYQPLPELAPEMVLPDGFDAWLRRMLAKSPWDRYRRAADAAWDLHALDDVTEETDEIPTIVDAGPIGSR